MIVFPAEYWLISTMKGKCENASTKISQICPLDGPRKSTWTGEIEVSAFGQGVNSFLASFEFLPHILQGFIVDSISLCIPGQTQYLRANFLALTIPQWPRWIILKMLSLRMEGINPFGNPEFTTKNIVLYEQIVTNFIVPGVRRVFFSRFGDQFLMNCLTCDRKLSDIVSLNSLEI
ncbi:hypothetical protein RF11_09067 [Thelohanellus kitauei]|uniref:Uncharacterized protein n=1 Tax=Thelohanellus kitauei TaxID=669202 RepID=A0A0C2IUA8_THEKT|nr:hypothetical protein RF11_09067 [Thelohanellus kitauei]